jgi:hypothetical protein
MTSLWSGLTNVSLAGPSTRCKENAPEVVFLEYLAQRERDVNVANVPLFWHLAD